MPSNPIATAAPAPLDPIASPTPRFFWQFDWGIANTGQCPKKECPLRPGYSEVGGVPTAADAPTYDKDDDTWQASGCHPTTLCMIADWLVAHEGIGTGIVVPGRTTIPEARQRGILSWAKWLFDPSGNPQEAQYKSATEHPPWVPRLPNKSKKQWKIDHAGLREKMKQLKRESTPLQFSQVALQGVSKEVARDRLAAAVRNSGPLALNILIPEHFVLLYGVRGNYLYIFDPGRSIFKHWASGDPGMPPIPEGEKEPPDEFSIVQPGASDFAIRFLPKSRHCHVIIDMMATFPKVFIKTVKEKDATGKDVKKKIYESHAFGDKLLLAESYTFANSPDLSAFLTAPAPDGRASRSGPATSPPPPPTPTAPPAPTPTPSTPSTSTQPPSPPPAPPAPPPRPAGDWPGGVIDWADAGAPPKPGRTVPPPPPLPIPSAATKGIFVVHVVNPITDTESQGARIEILPAATKAKGRSANGGWKSPALPNGRYMVKVHHPAHGPFYSEDAPSAEAPVEVPVDLVGAETTVTIHLQPLKDARAFVYVFESPGMRRLAGASVEIVGAFEKPTNGDGFVSTQRFKPGKYTVYAKLKGYGPIPAADQGPFEGWATQEVEFTAGDHVLLILMNKATPVVVPSLQGKTRNPDELSIVGPKDVQDRPKHEIFHEVVGPSPRTFTFTHKHKSSEAWGRWSLYDPMGREIDTNDEVMGIGDYDLDTAKMSAAAGDTLDSKAFGWWTLRLENSDFFEDYLIAYVAPLPHDIVSPPAKIVPQKTKLPAVTSSELYVDGVHFVDWYNDAYRKTYAGVTHPTLKEGGDAIHLCKGKMSKENFVHIFDRCTELYASQITFHEFLAILGIFFNEVGGGFTPVVESYGLIRTGTIAEVRTRMKYFFEPKYQDNDPTKKRKKVSYNGGFNKKAGDQLLEWNAITTPEEVAAWNSDTTFPADASDAVIESAKQCDFYKYSGKGLIQITWRSNYEKHVDPALVANGYSNSDDLTDDRLAEIVKTDWNVSVAMCGSFLRAHAALCRPVNENPPKWKSFASAVNKSGEYQQKVEWRADTLLHELERLNVECRPKRAG